MIIIIITKAKLTGKEAKNKFLGRYQEQTVKKLKLNLRETMYSLEVQRSKNQMGLDSTKQTLTR
jgi:hypothetical protein